MATVNSSPSVGSSHAPKTSTSNDSFLSSTPIQFDLVPPHDDIVDVAPNLQGPPKRINPFDQASGDVVETLEAAKEDAHYIESFIVRFLGSMEVKADRGMVIYPA